MVPDHVWRLVAPYGLAPTPGESRGRNEQAPGESRGGKDHVPERAGSG